MNNRFGRAHDNFQIYDILFFVIYVLHVDKDDDIEEKSNDDKDDKAEDPESGFQVVRLVESNGFSLTFNNTVLEPHAGVAHIN